MYQKLKYLTTCCVLFGSLFFSGCQQKNENELIVGICSDIPPYAGLNARGEYEGFDVDLAHAIGEKLHKKIIITEVLPWMFGPMLEHKKVDFISASTAISKIRLKQFAMIHTYGVPFPFIMCLFWGKIPTNIKMVQDLEHLQKPIGAVEGLLWQRLLEEKEYKNLSIFEHEQDMLLALKYGRISTAVVSIASAAFFKKHYPEIQIKKIALDTPWGQGAGICISKDNSKLITKLEKAIAELKEEGVIDELQEKWFGGVIR